MADVIAPNNAQEVGEALAWALAGDRRLDVRGHGTRAGIGRPAQSDASLDMSALSGITLYEPEELVLSARAGTPLEEIEAALAEKGQELAFEPIGHGALLAGDGAGRGTIGGALAANASGPRRLARGAARDHFLGVQAISGRGEAFKSGGRVVKNVTGYDLCKVLAGSWGTLAVMTDVTVKVMPRAETAVTLALLGLDGTRAGAAMARAMGSAAEVSGAAHLPEALAARSAVVQVAGLGRSVTALRLEGFAPSVEARLAHLTRLFEPECALLALDADTSAALWAEIRDARALAGGPERPLWRVSLAPGHGAGLAEALPEADALHDWAGGLVWLALDADKAGEDGGAARVRAALSRAGGGHATLVRAEPAVRAAVDVFEPQEPALAALSRRLKAGFDPSAILNPGRMYAGV